MASNKMLIDASHREETRVVVLRGNRIEEFDFESQNKRQLKGNIYLAKVTRVEPSLQAAFVDYGGNRHGFLAFNEIHPDYYQIPVADRQALLDEEAADAMADKRRDDMDNGEGEPAEASTNGSADADEDDKASDNAPEAKPKRRARRSRRKSNTAKAADETDATAEVADESPSESDGEVEASAEASAETSAEESSDNASETSSDSDATDTADTEASNSEADDSDGDDSQVDEDGKPTSIAAMIETDSISEPAPEEDDSGDDAGDDTDADAGEEEKPAPAAKKPRRTASRPRKKTKAQLKAEADAEAEEAPAVAEEQPAAPDKAEDKAEDKTEDNADNAENGAQEVQAAEEAPEAQQASSDESTPAEDDEAPKPKSRRRRRSRKSAKKDDANDSNDTNGAPEASDDAGDNGRKNRARNNRKNGNDDDNNGNDVVESSGQEDALEEVPQRRRARRQYKIQEVVKRRQVLLVQVVKEERGNKGAALTTYLSLAGRYSVLMPNTARGGGISRKITNAADRKRLKAIASDLEVPQGMGVILRTAGASRTKPEIKRDFEYLMRLWENVRNLTLSSSAPCLVYEEGSLIKRSIRDLYDKDTGEILVAGEEGHKEAQEFMAMLMPTHAKKVKLYREEQAMLAKFGVEQQLERMLGQQVTLKSGGYLVIDQTEALVAIDVNSGRATREHSIEDTALQTNLETAEEVARQLRLRDLAGLIVIDFIDMEENRNNRAVEKKLKECLKHDRARIQVGRISHFGLLEMSRQRMRASVLDSTMDVCPHCQGKGHVRSSSTVSLHILRAIEEHLLKNSRFDLIVKASSNIALYILNHKRPALMEIEERFGIKVYVEENRELLGEDFTLEKGEPSTGERKPVTHIQAGYISEDVEDIDEVDASSDGELAEAPDASEASEDEAKQEPSGKRRRRRRGGSKDGSRDGSRDGPKAEASEETGEVQAGEEGEAEPAEPGKRRRSRGKRAGRNRRKPDENAVGENAPVENAATENASQSLAAASNGPSADAVSASDSSSDSASNSEPVAEEKPAAKPRTGNSRPRKAKAPTAKSQEAEMPSAPVEEAVEASPAEEKPSADEPPRAKRRTTRRQADAASGEAQASDDSPVEEVVAQAASDGPEGSEPNKEETKQGGWWNRSGFFK